MPTLAVDTTAEFGSIALIDNQGGVREEVLLHAPHGFSGPLFDQIEALLTRQDVRLADIDLFAAASGPGSFTGVRIGLAAVKGLAEVLGKPVIAVSNLEALAELGEGQLRATVIDARRGEVFAALFDRRGAPVIAECVVRFTRFLEMLKDRECEFISSHFDPFRPALSGTRFERCSVVTAPRALAGTIGRIARRRSAAGAVGDPALIEANYVRRSDAELLWKHQA
jgi:tRNA threonylcarbamoyladenosine biosynthesis protein TsaB